jgi:TolA-binding protein
MTTEGDRAVVSDLPKSTKSWLLLLVGCGNKAKDLYDTAQLEEKQNNKPHAMKLYRQIVEEYPDSPYANQAKTCLAELEKTR